MLTHKIPQGILALGLVASPALALSSGQHRNDYLETASAKMTSPSPQVAAALGSVPNVYDFNSHLGSGKSVSYTGQSFRHLVAGDSLLWLSSLEAGKSAYSAAEIKSILNSYYDFKSDASSDHEGFASGASEFQRLPLDTAGQEATVTEGFVYDDVQYPGKQLRNKTAGNDNPLRRGALMGLKPVVWGQELAAIDADGKGDAFAEPEDFIELIFAKLADNASTGQAFTIGNETITEAHIAANGVDYKQLYQGFHLGAVAFSQAARDYLSSDLSPKKGINVSNDEPYSPGANYSVLEHHFDEAFGYLGVARDFSNYDQGLLQAGRSIDHNGDGMIAYTTEYNFAFAKLLAQTPQGMQLATELNKDMLTGRHLIASAPQGYRDYLEPLTVVALAKWEKGLAMLALAGLDQLSQELNRHDDASFSFRALAAGFGQAKGFGLAPQFSPKAVLKDASFDEFHQLLGDQPELRPEHMAAYVERLKQARQILAAAYDL